LSSRKIVRHTSIEIGKYLKKASFYLQHLNSLDIGHKMGIKERTAARRKRIVAHRAADFKDAENWDLDFWQSRTPEQRLSALVAIRGDVRKVEQARLQNKRTAEDG
jgi:hypothetical protein